MRRYLPMSDTNCGMNCDDIWYTFNIIFFTVDTVSILTDTIFGIFSNIRR